MPNKFPIVRDKFTEEDATASSLLSTAPVLKNMRQTDCAELALQSEI
jgi:hypothetical protein